MYANRSRYRRTRSRGSLTRGQALTAIGAGLVLAAYAHHATAPGGHSGSHAAVTDAAAAVSAGGTYGCAQLEALWERAGGSPSAAFLAAEVARAESGGNPGSTDDDGNGTVDRGLWQINSMWGPESTYDTLANARAAVAISRNGSDWSPWVTYQRGMEDGQC